jgi:Leucine-rich repeat (LRR) protein
MYDQARLPADLWQLPELRVLHFQTCPELVGLPENIPAAAKLDTLIIEGAPSFRRLPSSLCALSNLTNLILSGTNIEALPEFITQLTSLRVLIARNAGFPSLPPNMDRLTNLEVVKLDDVIIGAAFSNPMPSMRRLKIHEASHVQNTNFSGLASLSKLVMALKRDESQLNPSIWSLSSLEQLVMEDCGGLTTLPAELGRLTNLRTLHLANSEPFTLPEAISSLVSLRELVLGKSIQPFLSIQLTFPEAIRLPTSLTSLRMHGIVNSLPPTLTSLSRLRHFTLGCSVIQGESLPSLRTMPSPRDLRVEFGDFTDDNVSRMLSHASLTRLCVVRIVADDLDPVMSALTTLTNLRELHFLVHPQAEPEPGDGPLDPAIPESITNLSRLTYLSLHTPRLPGGVFLATSLQILQLDHTYLQEEAPDEPQQLSHEIFRLVNLRILDLPLRVELCSSVTRLSKLVEVRAQWDGDIEHRETIKELIQRGIQVDTDT